MRNWSIVTKIVLSALGIVMVLLLVSSLVLLKLEIDLVETMTDENLQKIEQSIEGREDAEKQGLHKNVILHAKMISLACAAYLYEFNPDGLKKFLSSYMNFAEDVIAIQVLDSEGIPFAAAWKHDDVMIDSAFPQDIDVDTWIAVPIEAQYEEEHVGSFHLYYTDASLTEKIEAIKEQASQESHILRDKSWSRLYRVLSYQSAAFIGVLLALMGCLIIVLKMLVLSPLKKVGDIASRLAKFDLTVTVNIKKRDEIGKLFLAIDSILRSFKHVLSQVQRSGIQVSSASMELSATAKQQEATLATQVTSTNNVVKATEEISEVNTHLMHTIQRVAAMSQKAASLAGTGQSDLLHMEDAMRRMEEASRFISGRLQTISEKTENITTVVTTITKVADQTNLLSLNAAIEAEKAGEFGRGFTVVAREIRRLADQTAGATLDIERMVEEMQSAVSSGMMEMETFIAEVRHNAEDVGRISAQMTHIIDQVQALSPGFEEVNHAMEHQSQNAQKINDAIVRLSEEMLETKETFHETHFAVEQLNEATTNLRDEVSRFKVT